MKKLKTLFCLLFCMMLVIGSSVCIYAEDSSRTYKVRFYSGEQGLFEEGEIKEFEFDASDSTARAVFRQSDVTLKDGSKYYVLGIRESGKDINSALTNPSFPLMISILYPLSRNTFFILSIIFQFSFQCISFNAIYTI